MVPSTYKQLTSQHLFDLWDAIGFEHELKNFPQKTRVRLIRALWKVPGDELASGCSAAEGRPFLFMAREPEAQPGGLTVGDHIRFCFCLEFSLAGYEGSEFTLKLLGLKGGLISLLSISTRLKRRVKDELPATGCLRSVWLTFGRGKDSFQVYQECKGHMESSQVISKSSVKEVS